MNKRCFTMLISIILLASCSTPQKKISYYVIDPTPMLAIANLDKKSVQVLDLKLPQYLERFQIARREGANRLTFSDNQQWGENLRKNLYRTMTRNLSTLLGTPDVGTAINRSLAKPDYVLRVSIEAFEQAADGRTQLAARYQISDDGGALLSTRQFSSDISRDSRDGYSEMVADLQALFAELCLDIATSLQQLEAQHAD
jgi:uncharacterized lipoprotein YmbA